MRTAAALAAAAVLALGASTAVAAPPAGGIVVPGKRLDGVKLGATRYVRDGEAVLAASA